MQSRRAKIIATVGPAISKLEKLTELAQAGVDVFRLNFSHGTYPEFAEVIGYIRQVERVVKRPIGILADIQGPKMRVGKLEGGEVFLETGHEIEIVTDPIVGGKKENRTIISIGYKEFVKDVGLGFTVLLDDGLLSLKVVDKQDNKLIAKVLNGGMLKQNKGVNVPEASFSARSITDKDYGDILFCLEQGVDYIALSFVRTAQEIRHLKSFIQSREKHCLVIAKVEKPDAINNIDEIIDTSDGILVARGDLAVEVGNERVPVLQKKIVRKCNLKGKTVIIATQMLMSMVDNPRPTRAEASDVANAVVDGADALMLSNETAVGHYPVDAVRMMDKIIWEMEQDNIYDPILFNEWQLPPSGQLSIAILQSAVRLASVVNAKAMVVVTQSGRAATLVSKCRPKNNILAITGSLETYRQLALQWGVQPLYMEDMENLIAQTSVFDSLGQRLLALNLCGSGDRIIVTAGLPRLAHGSTNTIKVHQI